MKVLRKEGGLKPGSRVELKVGPLHWTALHTAYVQNIFFVDEQIKGPFARWHHRHEFASEGSFTRLTDRIEYQLPGGPLIQVLFGWAIQLALHDMFRRRHRVTRQLCESPSS